MERLRRADDRFVRAVDAAVRPVSAWTGVDGGALALALGVLGAAVVTGTVAGLVRADDPGALGTLAVAVGALAAVTTYDVWAIASQVRAARRAAADGLLPTDPHLLRRWTWLALPLLVTFSLPLPAVVGLGVGALLLAAGYAAAGRARPARRRRRRVALGRLAPVGA